MATLGFGVSDIEVMEGHILDDLFLFVHIALGNRDVLFSFEVELSRVRVRSANALYCSAGGLDIDYISNGDLLLLNVLVDAWIKLELLGTLGRLETHDYRVYDFAISAMGVFYLFR